MVTIYAVQVIIEKGEEKKFRKHFRRLYVNKEGQLSFFRRVPATKYTEFKEKINKIGKAKIT